MNFRKKKSFDWNGGIYAAMNDKILGGGARRILVRSAAL